MKTIIKTHHTGRSELFCTCDNQRNEIAEDGHTSDSMTGREVEPRLSV